MGEEKVAGGIGPETPGGDQNAKPVPAEVLAQGTDHEAAKNAVHALIDEALAARGCVIFVGMLSDEKDDNGNFKLQFSYQRQRYPFEDLRKAVIAFQDHCRQDAMRMVG